jgi:hypothetical protein
MITNFTISPEANRYYIPVRHTSASTVVRTGADTCFLYGLLWALIAATLLTGSIAATLAAALVSVPV